MIEVKPFDEATRRALRAALAKVGVDETIAAEAVDLACHGAATAVASLLTAAGRASNRAAYLSIVQIGAQLALARFESINVAVGITAEELGLRRTDINVAPQVKVHAAVTRALRFRWLLVAVGAAWGALATYGALQLIGTHHG